MYIIQFDFYFSILESFLKCCTTFGIWFCGGFKTQNFQLT